MKKSFFLLISTALMVLFTGCSCWSGKYVSEKKLEIPKTYPFTFYINSMSIKQSPVSGNAFPVEEEDEIAVKRLKDNLCLKYPQYFSSSPKKSLPVNIEIITQSHQINQRTPETTILGILAGFSYGLIPVPSKHFYQWKIILSLADIQCENTVFLEVREIRSVYLGTLLQTHRWIPNMDGYHVASNENDSMLNPDSEPLLAFFVDALKKLNRNKIMEFYYSRMEDKTSLLE